MQVRLSFRDQGQVSSYMWWSDCSLSYAKLTLYPLQFGAPKGHGQVERDEVLVVTHGHQEIEFHFSQHLRETKKKQNKHGFVLCTRHANYLQANRAKGVVVKTVIIQIGVQDLADKDIRLDKVSCVFVVEKPLRGLLF